MASKLSALPMVFVALLVSSVLALAQELPPLVPIPNIPGLPIPGAPLPNIPGLPIPGIPRVPGVPEVTIPGIPTVPGAPNVPIPGVPGVPGATEVQECWASIINIGGCYAEIYRAFLSGQASFTVGPACCKAVKDLSSTCWPRMFPYNPIFPPLLQNYCSQYTKPEPAVPVGDAPIVAPAPDEEAPTPAAADVPPVALAPEEDAPAPAAADAPPVAPAPEEDAPAPAAADVPPVAPAPEAGA